MNGLQREGKHELRGNSKPWIAYYNGKATPLSKNEVACLEFKIARPSTLYETNCSEI